MSEATDAYCEEVTNGANARTPESVKLARAARKGLKGKEPRVDAANVAQPIPAGSVIPVASTSGVGSATQSQVQVNAGGHKGNSPAGDSRNATCNQSAVAAVDIPESWEDEYDALKETIPSAEKREAQVVKAFEAAVAAAEVTIDVGSGGKYSRTPNATHYIDPIQSTTDAVRQAFIRERPRNRCDHLLKDCTCIHKIEADARDQGKRTTYVCRHSAYHFDQPDWEAFPNDCQILILISLGSTSYCRSTKTTISGMTAASCFDPSIQTVYKRENGQKLWANSYPREYFDGFMLTTRKTVCFNLVTCSRTDKVGGLAFYRATVHDFGTNLPDVRVILGQQVGNLTQQVDQLKAELKAERAKNEQAATPAVQVIPVQPTMDVQATQTVDVKPPDDPPQGVDNPLEDDETTKVKRVAAAVMLSNDGDEASLRRDMLRVVGSAVKTHGLKLDDAQRTITSVADDVSKVKSAITGYVVSRRFARYTRGELDTYPYVTCKQGIITFTALASASWALRVNGNRQASSIGFGAASLGLAAATLHTMAFVKRWWRVGLGVQK